MLYRFNQRLKSWSGNTNKKKQNSKNSRKNTTSRWVSYCRVSSVMCTDRKTYDETTGYAKAIIFRTQTNQEQLYTYLNHRSSYAWWYRALFLIRLCRIVAVQSLVIGFAREKKIIWSMLRNILLNENALRIKIQVYKLITFVYKEPWLLIKHFTISIFKSLSNLRDQNERRGQNTFNLFNIEFVISLTRCLTSRATTCNRAYESILG